MLKSSNYGNAFALFAICILISLGVLNRWLVTDLGFLSYGRIWQLYISYEDFGFTRRALVGTILSYTGINTLANNEYHFALIIHHVLLFTLSAQIFYYILKNRIGDAPLIATIVLSPALIIQSSYTTGSLDIFILILSALNILYIRNKYVFSTIIIVGVLIHELFLFTVPAQVASYVIYHRRLGEDKFFSFYLVSSSTISIALLLVFTFGISNLPQSAVEDIMEDRMPNAARQHSLWSGYVEISRSVSDNATESLSRLSNDIVASYQFLLIPLIYVALVTARLFVFTRDRLGRIILVISTTFPFLVTLVATDIYRWVGMSASVGLLLTLSVLTGRKNTYSKITYALLPFSVMAPFGAAQIDWPFPVLQFILAAITRS